MRARVRARVHVWVGGWVGECVCGWLVGEWVRVRVGGWMCMQVASLIAPRIYIYIMAPARLKELLDALREVGVVEEVARQALQQRVQRRLDRPAKGGNVKRIQFSRTRGFSEALRGSVKASEGAREGIGRPPPAGRHVLERLRLLRNVKRIQFFKNSRLQRVGA